VIQITILAVETPKILEFRLADGGQNNSTRHMRDAKAWKAK
jgi:hypothetical protein